MKYGRNDHGSNTEQHTGSDEGVQGDCYDPECKRGRNKGASCERQKGTRGRKKGGIRKKPSGMLGGTGRLHNEFRTMS